MAASDVSLMDILFDRDDPVFKFMDDKIFKEELDDIGEEVKVEWTGEDDLLTDILKNEFDMEKDLSMHDGNSLHEWVASPDDVLSGSLDCYSDSGASSDATTTTTTGLVHDDDLSSHAMLDVMPSEPTLKQQTEDDTTSQGTLGDGPKKRIRQVLKVSPMLSSSPTTTVNNNNVSNPRSVLLPVNTGNGIRTYKIISPNGGLKTLKPVSSNQPLIVKSLRPVGIPMIVRNNGPKKTKCRTPPPVASFQSVKSVSEDGSDEEVTVVSEEESEPDSSVNNSNSSGYPRLILSSEEKKLMQKEGVRLPTHLPLTKAEERELKRIRRKIRNKISAQDSRKRKKEYLDGLEDRVKQCTQENLTLVKRIKYLQAQNQSLVAQLKKLQNALARTTTAAQPGTCLMVLILSVALIVAPNLRLTSYLKNEQQQDQEEAVTTNSNVSPGRSRTLLSSTSTINSGVLVGNDECIVKMEDDVDVDDVDVEDLLQFHEYKEFDMKKEIDDGSSGYNSRKSSLSEESLHFLADHDYDPPPSKRGRYALKPNAPKQFIVPIVDDIWPPPPDIKPLAAAKQLIVPEVDDHWIPGSAQKPANFLDKVNASEEAASALSRTVLVHLATKNDNK